MAPLPVGVLLGIYLGILTGIIPGLVAWVLGFGFKYITGVTVPGFAVVVLAIALAGVSGGLLALADPTVTQSANAPTVVTAILLVTGIALYAHAKGDQMGARAPRRLSLSKLGERTLSRDVVELIGGRDEIRIRIGGDVGDMEGYPPLSDEFRATLRDVEYTFPADLRIAELEDRFAERIRTEFDLVDVAVTVDEEGRASVTAAPPFSGLSKRVPAGKRAVSVNGLLPTGLARGDEVTLATADDEIQATVLSARTNGHDGESVDTSESSHHRDENPPEDAPSSQPAARAPTTTGGDGRLTAAVSRSDADPLLRADNARVAVDARGTRVEYELVTLLRRSGQRFRRVTVAQGGALDGATVGTVNVRERYGVAVFGVRRTTGWQLVPSGDETLTPGDELFVVGSRDALNEFTAVVA